MWKIPPPKSSIRRKNISGPVFSGPEYERKVLMFLLKASLVDRSLVHICTRFPWPQLAPGKHCVHFVSVDIPFQDMSYKCNHHHKRSFTPGFIQPAFCFLVCCSLLSILCPYSCWIVFCLIDISHFVYSFINWWSSELFPLLGYLE